MDGGVRRAVALWAVLVAAAAATLGVPATDEHRYAGVEPHVLLTAHAIVHGDGVDVRHAYATRAYRSWYDGTLTPRAVPVDGHLREPQGVGFPLLVAPAYALGGPLLVRLELAALAALAFVLAAAIARRIVPDPWATLGPLACGLSAPALAGATAIAPEMAAAAALTGAALLALRARERPRVRTAVGAGLLLATLPWLGVAFLPAGAVVLIALVRWMARHGRGTAGLVGAEVVFFSLVLWVSVNDTLFAGLTPDAVALPGDPERGLVASGDVLTRLGRIVGVWLDRDAGLLRWAPLFALALFGGWLLWRSHRERVVRALPERAGAEAAAGLALAIVGVQVLTVALATPTLDGPWLGPRHLGVALPAAAVLVAWGLRHAPRVGAALAALTLLASAWLLVALWLGGGSWADPGDAAPWGWLSDAFPPFGVSSPWAAVVTGAVAAGGLALLVRELRRQLLSRPASF